MAPPPPLQIPAIPYLALYVFNILTKLSKILEPDTPIGCPKATAPPYTLTLSRSKSNNFI